MKRINISRTAKEQFFPSNFYRVIFFNPHVKEASVYLLQKKEIDERNVFYYKENAYVFDKNAVILINKTPYLLYVEENPSPIHFNGAGVEMNSKMLAKVLKTDLELKFLYSNPHIDFLKLMVFGIIIFAAIIIAIKVLGGA